MAKLGRVAWRRYLRAYMSSIALIGFPIAVGGVSMYWWLGGWRGLAFGLVAAPLAVFAAMAALSLAFLPFLIWAANHCARVKFAALLLSPVYVIALREIVLIGIATFDKQAAQRAAGSWNEPGIIVAIGVVFAISAAFFVLEGIMKFEERSQQR